MIDKFSAFGFTWFFIYVRKQSLYVQNIERIAGQLCAYTIAIVCT